MFEFGNDNNNDDVIIVGFIKSMFMGKNEGEKIIGETMDICRCHNQKTFIIGPNQNVYSNNAS